MGGASSQSGLCCRVFAQHDVILTVSPEPRKHCDHEYLATSARPLNMFCKIFTAAKTFLDVATCKIKHLQNICKNVLDPREVDGSKTFLQMFYFTCRPNQALSSSRVRSC